MREKSPPHDGVPAELRGLSHWVVCGDDKIPHHPLTGRRASAVDPRTWCGYDDAVHHLNGRFKGLGFMFQGSGFAGVDLDKCRDLETGEIEPWALDVVRELNSYAEISQSGKGLHVIVKGKLPPEGRRKDRLEMYDSGRFFWLTGDRLDGAPGKIEERQAELDALHSRVFGQAKTEDRNEKDRQTDAVLSDEEIIVTAEGAANGEKFKNLFAGNWEGAYSSQSEADDALCCMLAFYTGRNAGQMDRIFRRSGLLRSKWDSARGASTYGEDTIRKACEQTKETYDSEHYVGDSANLLVHKCNDAGNVDRLVAWHGWDLRYCHPMKKWLYWDGGRWAEDDRKHANYLAKLMFIEYLDQAAREENDVHQKFAKSCLDVRRINSLLEMATADPRLIIRPSELDQYPYLLNFQNTTVDLRTGELRAHSREDYLTQILEHEYDPGAACPEWLKFLDTVMGGDQEMLGWLRKAIGYSLTGRATEKKVFICHGGGNNGKTTFLDVKRQILGPYAGKLQISSLMSQRNKSDNSAQPDQASLRAKRDIMTSETDEDQWLDEQEVKLLSQGTGMATYRARRLYEDYIEFPETWTIWLDANHRPQVKGRDDAIWNRLCLIPFNVTIPDDRIDRHLTEKLMAEAPGILAWMVVGAVQWCELEAAKVGLGRPPEIEEAVQKWRDDNDSFADFVEARCLLGPNVDAATCVLRKEYESWCEDEGYRPLGAKKYGERLRELNCEPGKDKQGNRIWKGIKLLHSGIDDIRQKENMKLGNKGERAGRNGQNAGKY